MKPTIFLFLLLLGISSIRAQDKAWSVELNYPISIGDDFGASNQGLFGLGVKYRFASNGNWKFGASLDGVWFSTEFVNDSDPPQTAKVRDLFIQPRLFASLSLTQNGKLRAFSGLGWTVYRVKTENLVGDQSISKEENWNNGFNGNLGLSYDISSAWFVQTQYDYIYFSGTNGSNSLVGLIKLGGGFRF
jgi:opacity protein-like surface antigen